jgi:hypothetical protein
MSYGGPSYKAVSWEKAETTMTRSLLFPQLRGLDYNSDSCEDRLVDLVYPMLTAISLW